MDSSISVALSAQRAIFRQLDVVANNIANANSVGYRAEEADFKTILSTATPDRTNFVQVSGIRINSTEGAHLQTGNPLDLAITGPGYFSMTTPGGQVFTRDGRLTVSVNGELQSITGLPINDSGGAPIILANGGTGIRIHPDGRIEQSGRIVADIGVFNLTDEMIGARYGNASFSAKQVPAPIVLGTSTSISQGFVENSNTNPMMELANLIELQRSFESVSSMIERADSTLQKSIGELGRNR